MAERNVDLTSNLNWFGFETRIRKIIASAISPIVEQIKDFEDTQKLNDLKFGNINNDVKELNNKIHRTIKRTNELNEIRSNLFDLSQSVRAHEIVNYEKHGNNNVNIKSLKDKVKLISEDFQNMEAINNNLKSEIENYISFTLEHKVFFNDKISEMNTEFNNSITELCSKVSKLELSDSFKDGIIDQHKLDIEKIIFDIEYLKMNFESNLSSIQHFNKMSKIINGIDKEPSESKEIEENKICDVYFKDSYTNKHMKILSNRIDQLEKELRMTDNYIEKQIPVTRIKEICEVIDFCISSKEVRSKVKEYVDYKLTELNEIIENDKGWPTYSKKIAKADISNFKFENSPLVDYISNTISNKGDKNNGKRKSRISEALLKKSLTKIFVPSLLEPRNFRSGRKESLSNRNSSYKIITKCEDTFTEHINNINFNEEESASSISDSSGKSSSSETVEQLNKELPIDSKKLNEEETLRLPKQNKISKRISMIGNKLIKRNMLQIDTNRKRLSTTDFRNRI